MSYKDRTWCASPNCQDKCGRKMSDNDRILASAIGQDQYMSYAYFCGTSEEITTTKNIIPKLYQQDYERY